MLWCSIQYRAATALWSVREKEYDDWALPPVGRKILGQCETSPPGLIRSAGKFTVIDTAKAH